MLRLNSRPKLTGSSPATDGAGRIGVNQRQVVQIAKGISPLARVIDEIDRHPGAVADVHEPDPSEQLCV